MFVNFYFQVYRKQHSSSRDHFELILGRIPDEYKFNRHKVKSTCLALDNKLFEKLSNPSLHLREEDGIRYVVLDEIKISFQIALKDDNVMELINHLKSVDGLSEATSYELILRDFMNEVE